MILSAVLCALFPYASIGVIYVLIKGYFPAAFPWEIFSALLYMAELWLIALIAVLLLLRRKERYTPLALARAVMIVKLVQIPAYAGILLLGMGFSLTVYFAVNVVFFLFDVLTIALSGLLGVAAVSRAQEEGIFTKYHAERLGIFQFIFCVDVVASMISYCRLHRAKKSAG